MSDTFVSDDSDLVHAKQRKIGYHCIKRNGRKEYLKGFHVNTSVSDDSDFAHAK